MDTRSTALYGKPFTAVTPEQQTELLTKLAAASGHAADDEPRSPFFTEIKQMTITGCTHDGHQA
jgi:hypothetical protein